MDSDFDRELVSAPPVDYSFRKLKRVTDIQNGRPRTLRTRREVARGPNGKFLSRSIWFNSNSLNSTVGIKDVIAKYFEFPDQVQWVDFAFNRLEDVSEDLLSIKSIQMLYLHGNCISNMQVIAKLKKLPNLRSLTLHGCPIETEPFYREKIIFLLPGLKNLDFVTVTKKEVQAPPPPGAIKDSTETVQSVAAAVPMPAQQAPPL